MTDFTPISRRQALLLGGAALAALGTGTFGALADVVSDAKIEASSEMAKAVKKSGPFKIGFSNGFSGNTWRTECLASLRAEADAHKDTIGNFIIVDGQGDITKQVNDIDDLIVQQVDAILCIPNSGTAVAPALRKATRAGIVTVPFNLPVDGTNFSAYVGTNPANKGTALGKFLNDALGGKGKIVALGGLPGNSYTATAWEASKKEFAPGIEILAFQDTNWAEDRAKVVMADLIAANPQIDGVWCDGGQVASGAMKALLAANRPLVPVTGDDFNGILKLYDSEKANQPKFKIGLVSEPTWEGVVALRTAIKLLSGQDVPKNQTIGAKLITRDNYQNYIKKDLPDGVFVDTNLTDDELKKLFT
jgi:ribose transport system substrate-binding protein